MNGSPRVHGNSAIVSGMLSESLQASPARVSVMRLHEMKIKPCTDCRSCKSGLLECITRDDMRWLSGALERSAYIIFVTPVYWFGPTSQTKLVIDRLRPYFLNGRLKGKPATVITVAGEGYRDSTLVFSMFRRIFRTLGMIESGMFALKGYDAGDVILNTSFRRVLRSCCINITDGNFNR